MTFLAGSLLPGLVLASVPIIIHILNRRRFQIIDWPPMKYLKLTLKRNRRRIRIEQMILLAMRTLAVILLIIAVARPVIPQEGLAAFLPGRTRVSRLIVIDDSLSMGYTTAGRSAYQLAQNAAAELLHAAGAQDSVTILLTSAPDRPPVRDGNLQDAEKFVRLVEEAPLTDTPSHWAATLEAVNRALATAPYADKEVVLITDLRRSGWTKDVRAPADALAEARVAMRIVDVGDRRTDDVALTKFDLEDAVPLPDQPIHLTAEIRNHTPADIVGGQATLSVDGDSRPVLLPKLPAGSTTSVPLTLTLDTPGTHTLSLSLTKDALPRDDVRYLNLDVRPTISVLLIDGAPSAQKFESETDFLALAYSLGARPWNVQRITQFDPRRLTPGSPDLPDVLVLANVPSLTAEQAALIERLVRRGMGLIVFSGDLVDVELYNSRLYRDGQGLLPAKLERPAETPTTGIVVEKDPQSPLAPLAKLLPEALARIHVRQYSGVKLASLPAEGVSVLARWNNSETPPAVLQKTFGKGRVLLFTCTAGKKWSDWPVDPTYLLTVRSAALSVARSQASGGSLTAGETIRLPLENGQTAFDPKMTPPGAKTPESAEMEKTGADTAALKFTKTTQSGIYSLAWKDEKSASRSARFAVNSPLSESELEPISEQVLAELLGNLRATVRRYDAGGAGLTTPPREVWRPLAQVLLGLLGVEVAFAVWVGRER